MTVRSPFRPHVSLLKLRTVPSSRTPISLNDGKLYSAVTKTNRRAREGAEIAEAIAAPGRRPLAAWMDRETARSQAPIGARAACDRAASRSISAKRCLAQLSLSGPQPLGGCSSPSVGGSATTSERADLITAPRIWNDRDLAEWGGTGRCAAGISGRTEIG